LKAIYNEKQDLHTPRYQFAGGRRRRHPDVPERTAAILEAVREADFEVVAPRPCTREDLRAVHADDYLDYLAGAYEAWAGISPVAADVIPGTFPVREPTRMPGDIPRLAGWYCLDTETPIGRDTFEAAMASAACALTGADVLLSGECCAYALCRPPGHHAGRDYCGGYCYLNNAALSAERLSTGTGAPLRVAILDLDAHHGNGTQDIFYESDQVLYVSVHADPNATYPYFWGYAEETGAGPGNGFNLNLPLPRDVRDAAYLDGVELALAAIERFEPAFVVVSLGTDGAAEDRVGPFALKPDTFETMGRLVAGLRKPSLVVQEGGYDPESLVGSVMGFLTALPNEAE